MKATINSTLLEKELKFISPVIRKHNVIPITGGVKFDFEKETVTITATNLETTAISSFPCVCKKPFSVVLVYDDILKICSRMSEPLTIEEEGNSIFVRSDSSNFKFAKLGDVKHFPNTPDEEIEFCAEVEGDFFYALNQANSCRSKDENMVLTNMPCIDFKKDEIVVVGTTGSMCFLSKIKVGSAVQARVMVSDAFVQMTKSFQATKLYVNEKRIKAESGNKIIISLLGEQKFVNYERAFPDGIMYNLKMERADLQNRLQMIGIALESNTSRCIFHFQGELMKITAKNIEFEKEADTQTLVENDVKIESIGVNGSHILQLLSTMQAEEIEMSFMAPEKTIYIKPVDDDSVICLSQPLTINL